MNKYTEGFLIFCVVYISMITSFLGLNLYLDSRNETDPVPAFDQAGFIILDKENRIVNKVLIKNGVVVEHWTENE